MTMTEPQATAPAHQQPASDQALVSLLSRVRLILAGEGVRAYLVGGFLRDALLGYPTHDVDIAVEGDALGLSRRLADALGGSWVLLDAENGVGRIVLTAGVGSAPSATSGQALSLSKGSRLNLDLSRLAGDPSAGAGQAVREDLARRDFTANALAAPLEAIKGGSWTALWTDLQASLIDPFGGRRDIEARVLRVVSESAFADDPARLLRAVRFVASLGFRLDATTEGLARRDATLLARATPERVREEFLRILELPYADRHIRLLDGLGLLDVLLPELGPARGCAQPREHHWDVFDHCIETVGAVEHVLRLQPGPPSAGEAAQRMPWPAGAAAHFAEEASDGHTRATLVKLAALLHDVAKPETKSVEPSGRIRFFGHHAVGARRAQVVLERLRFSGRGVRLVTLMVEHHLRPAALSDSSQLPTRRALYRYFRDAGEAALSTLYLNAADYLAARGPDLDLKDWERYCGHIAYALEWWKQQKAQAPAAAPRLVDGNILMEALGLKPGPLVGRLLDALQEAEAVGEVTTREAALDLARRLLRQLQKPGHVQ